MAASNSQISRLLDQEYAAGFITDIDADSVPPGLSEEVIRLISAKKQEPQFLLDWRLKAYRHWLTMPVPQWSSVHYPPIDYNAISYYSSPKSRPQGPGQPRGGRSEAAGNLRKAWHSAGGTGIAGRRCRGCGV